MIERNITDDPPDPGKPGAMWSDRFGVHGSKIVDAKSLSTI
jgi:hypothetical protein